MPHITEEIYHLYFAKAEDKKSIHISAWPQLDSSLASRKAEKAGDMAIDVIAAIRKFKSANSMPMPHPLRAVTIASNAVRPVLRDIQKTMKIESAKIGKLKEKTTETEKFKIELEIMQ